LTSLFSTSVRLKQTQACALSALRFFLSKAGFSNQKQKHTSWSHLLVNLQGAEKALYLVFYGNMFLIKKKKKNSANLPAQASLLAAGVLFPICSVPPTSWDSCRVGALIAKHGLQQCLCAVSSAYKLP
jgi:hypothetical protein